MKKSAFSLNGSILLMSTALCVLTALLQGIPSLASLPRDGKMAFFVCLLLLSFSLLLLLHKKGKLTEDRMVFAILFLSMLLRCLYVTLSGLYDRQHDEGVYTGIASSQVNPGHIGYIEYIYKFRRLPDFNPYQLFSYYHPPLHYVLSGVFLILLTALGMPEQNAFENLQILPLFYSGLFLLLAFRILKKTGAQKRALYAGLILCAFHPALTVMSGSVNNDMLSCVLLACSLLAALCYLEEKTLKNLICIALSIGLGMLCKINTALIALPVGLVLLMDFIRTARRKDQATVRRTIRRYLLFGVIAAVVGLSFIVRNLLLFHVMPGIASATEDSVMYTGGFSLWSRIGIPALSDWHFSFPFHSLNGAYNHNIWVILFQTSLFAEEFPAQLGGFPLFLCRTVYVLAILSGIACAVLFTAAMIKKYRKTPKKDEAVFLLAGFLTFLAAFVVFSVKYPYTCSSDFRYILFCLIYLAIGLSDSPSHGLPRKDGHGDFPGKPFKGEKATAASALIVRTVRAGACLTVILTSFLYMIWRQW